MDIIQLSRDLGTAIQECPEYKRIFAAKAANDADKELQSLIEEFNMTRVKLSTAMQAEDKDEAKLAELDKILKESYATVMGNKNMLEFNDAKQEMDLVMNQVNTILGAALNGEDPQNCESKPDACGGSCSSCSGCH